MKQCKKCPWLIDADPHAIPNGYCEEKHKALKDTISTEFNYDGSGIRMMACHETPIDKEKPCAGWVANQLGVGNNIGLRMMAIHRLISWPELVGEQHVCFEDTLPLPTTAQHEED